MGRPKGQEVLTAYPARLPDDVRGAMKQLAEKNNLSQNTVLIKLVRKGINASRKKKNPA